MTDITKIMRRADPRTGFTLIELMIVMAIIGVLTAIAFANFTNLQLRSRMGEARANLAAIRTAEEAYFSENGSYVASGIEYPPPPESNVKRLWVPLASGGFDTIGYVPEGEVYFTYTAVATNLPAPAFSLGARGDIDADGLPSFYGYVKAFPAATTGLPVFGGACAATGVYDGVTMATDLLRTVGPCDAASGANEF